MNKGEKRWKAGSKDFERLFAVAGPAAEAAHQNLLRLPAVETVQQDAGSSLRDQALDANSEYGKALRRKRGNFWKFVAILFNVRGPGPVIALH